MASMTAQLLGTAQKIVPPRRRKSSMTAQLLGVKPMPEMPKPPKHLVKTVKAQEMRDCDEVFGTRFDNWRDFEGSLSPVTAPSLRKFAVLMRMTGVMSQAELAERIGKTGRSISVWYEWLNFQGWLNREDRKVAGKPGYPRTFYVATPEGMTVFAQAPEAL